MEDDMNKLWEKFSLLEEEDEEVFAPEDEVEPMVKRGSACVVGKLLADRMVGKGVIRPPLIRAWQPTGNVTFKTLGKNLFLIEFEHEWDKIRIMEGRPWTFDRDLLSLADFDGITPVEELEFEKAAFWVRMYKLPLACMSKAIGHRIGATVGEVLEVEVDDEGVGWGEYLRLRIVLDLTKPLSRGRQLRLRDRSLWILFKYEKIPRFCFSCGIIRHGPGGCMNQRGRRALGDAEETQFGKWLSVTPPGYRYGGGGESHSNGNGRGSKQPASYDASDGIDGKEDPNFGLSSDTGEEETGGESTESSTAPVRKRGDTSALQASLHDSHMVCENQGDPLRQVREEAVGGDLGDRYRGKLKSPNVKIAVDLVEKEIHDDSSKLQVEEDSNSKKARSIYVGQ
jgi:hypothetical protein